MIGHLLLAVATSAPDVPPGFRPVPERVVWRMGPDAKIGGWMVSLDGNRLRVEPHFAWRRRLDAEVKAWRRPATALKIDMGGSIHYWTADSGLRVDDGWLQEEDNGEFGGGIYLIAKDKKSYRKVSDDNTKCLAKTSRGIFAVQGLAHLSGKYARLVEVERGLKGWKTRFVTDLHEVPEFVVAAGDAFVHTADREVCRLDTDGTHREIYQKDFQTTFQSMVSRANGEVWLGTSHGLLRLVPKGNEAYGFQWFVSKKLHPTNPVEPKIDED